MTARRCFDERSPGGKESKQETVKHNNHQNGWGLILGNDAAKMTGSATKSYFKSLGFLNLRLVTSRSARPACSSFS